MEGLTPRNTSSKNLQCQARRLVSAAISLTNLFAEEASRLNRRDEASRLKALYFSIRRQLYWAKSNEDAASYGYSQANLVVSLGGLVVGGAIKMISKSELLSAFSDNLFASLTDKQRPFGMVLVCIGPGGLPDDTGVVSISRLARESNRAESEVINALQAHGYLLLSEKDFSLLVDRLIDAVQEGRLLLPVSTEKLSELKTSGLIRLKSEN